MLVECNSNQIFGFPPAGPELEQSADGFHRRNDRLGDEIESGWREGGFVDVALRAEKDRFDVRRHRAQRLGHRDAWVEMSAGPATGEKDRSRRRFAHVRPRVMGFLLRPNRARSHRPSGWMSKSAPSAARGGRILWPVPAGARSAARCKADPAPRT